MKRSGAGSFQDFYQLLQTVHQIPRVDVLLGYTDIHGDLLPINNDDNYHKALSSANPLLRVIIQKKGKQGTGSVLLSREMSHIPQYCWFHLWTVPAGAWLVTHPPATALVDGCGNGGTGRLPEPCQGCGTRPGSPWQPRAPAPAQPHATW